MKKTTFTLLLSLRCCWLAAQCPMGDITFSTQAQIDNFQINYPGCTDIPGRVEISGDDITNLQGLSALDSVYGCLFIEDNPLLTSLQGLENLTYVGECQVNGPSPFNTYKTHGLTIQNNAMLASVSGLDNLKYVKTCVTIDGNPSLTVLNGLNGLSTVGSCLYYGPSGGYYTHSLEIVGNNCLKTIGGLASLDSLYILDISSNDSLLSLNGLENLDNVGGNLIVSKNPSLPDFNGLGNLQSIGGVFSVRQNGSLQNFHGLANLQSIGGGFFISDNDSLKNFHGLENLKSLNCQELPLQSGLLGVEPTLYVENNHSLIDFQGLENLQSISCSIAETYAYSSIRILGNWSLQSLTGIGGSIDSLSELRISNNPNLSVCDIQAICDYLENNDSVYVSYNAPGCNSVEEVEAACIVSIEETSTGLPVVIFYPNPASEFLQIQVSDNEQWEVSLFDLRGSLLYQRSASGSHTVLLRDWSAGLYTLRAVSGGRVFAGKIVKQ